MGASRRKKTAESVDNTEAYKAYVEDLLRFCLQWINHTEYSYTITLKETPHPDQESTGDVMADVTVNDAYLYLSMNVFPPFKKQFDDGEFRECGSDVLHEVCHLFTAPIAKLFMWDSCESHKAAHTAVIERQTQRIRNSVREGMPDNWYMPERVAKLSRGEK